MNRDFYIYQHLRNDGVPFYIGKGKNKRAYSRHQRSEFWNAIVNKHGLIVEIIAGCLTEQEAFLHERRFIAFYGRRDRNGILVNLTDGGDGVAGNFGNQNWKCRIETEETRRKKSESHKGKKRPDHSLKMKGNNWPRPGRKYTKQTEVTKQKLREANLGRKDPLEVRANKSAGQYRRWANFKDNNHLYS